MRINTLIFLFNGRREFTGISLNEWKWDGRREFAGSGLEAQVDDDDYNDE